MLIHRKCSISSYSGMIPVIFDDEAYFKPFKPKPLTQFQIILPPMFRLPYHVRLIHHRKRIDRLRSGHYFWKVLAGKNNKVCKRIYGILYTVYNNCIYNTKFCSFRAFYLYFQSWPRIRHGLWSIIRKVKGQSSDYLCPCNMLRVETTVWYRMREQRTTSLRSKSNNKSDTLCEFLIQA